jgi:hypothetical protein
MAFIQQTVAGAAEYTGLAGAGLLQFDLSAFTGPNWVPRIDYLALTIQGAAATGLIAVGLSTTAAANRAELVNDVGNSFLYPCPLTLGKLAFNNIHEVYVTTTGKTGAGVLECVWYPYNAAR